VTTKSGQAGRNALALLVLGLIAALVLVSARAHPTDPVLRAILGYVSDFVYWPLYYGIGMFLTPSFAAVMGLVLLLEWLIPARPRRRWLSVSLAQDFVWFFYENILHAAIIAVYVTLLARIYAHLARSLPLPTFDGIPTAIRIAGGIVIVDFCYWAQHRCNHAFRPLWLLHTVHHSQRDLNFFTDFRYHVLEYIVRETFLAIPFIMLHVSIPDIVIVSVFLKWYTRFYHANIRSDLWLLRYVLVTPQSHRIHHSIEPEHQDKNFGSLFSIWDFMFGTQVTAWRDYPETGIADQAFPHETSGDIASLLLMPIRQMIYPLRQIVKRGA
jgi:sterol desaturase/sphingolipid hydroxylase (fatty acid hydroxylase superfamily)